MNTAVLPGGFSQDKFLTEYWQQKPLLIRQAFPHIQPPCSAEELAGLCCDTEAPARLVIEQERNRWQLLQSPFEERHFLELPDTHWTLLVNDFEQYYPKLLEEIISHFRFIPDWRIDDLMISYAPEGGSVGPHIDEYDVFLIQVSGERQWMLDPDADASNILPDCELSILAEFNAQQDWTLRAGDLLYLPPRLAHYGIAQATTDPHGCMTYSVGFRSPNQQELLDAWLNHLWERNQGTQRYSDKKRQPQKHTGEISKEDLQGLKQVVLESIEQPEQLASWLGSYLTHAKNEAQDIEQLTDHLPKDTACFRHPDTRIAWVQQADHLQLFINGMVSRWPLATKAGVEYLCSHYHYTDQELKGLLEQADFHNLYHYLCSNNFLQLL